MPRSRSRLAVAASLLACLVVAVLGPGRSEARDNDCKSRGERVKVTERCCAWLEPRGPIGQKTCRACGGRDEEPCGVARCRPGLALRAGRCIDPSRCGGEDQEPCPGLQGCDPGFTRWLRDGKCHRLGERIEEARDAVADALKPGERNNEWRKKRCAEPRAGVKSTRWVEDQYKYPSGSSWDRGQVCEWTTPDGRTLFEDGCSGQAAGGIDGVPWGVRFHEACVLHDMCYHHNPSTYGHDQKYCDDQMFDGMKAICRDLYGGDAVSHTKCVTAATEMFVALRTAGAKHFAAFDIQVPYRDLFQPAKKVLPAADAGAGKPLP
jgi:hypothetical protein